MPSHRADTPPLRSPLEAPPMRRPRTNRTSGSAARNTRPSGSVTKPKRPRTSLSAPQVGIAGALGIATIAAPISGAMANPMPKAQVNHLKVVAAAPDFASFPSLPTAGGLGVKALRVGQGAGLDYSNNHHDILRIYRPVPGAMPQQESAR